MTDATSAAGSPGDAVRRAAALRDRAARVTVERAGWTAREHVGDAGRGGVRCRSLDGVDRSSEARVVAKSRPDAARDRAGRAEPATQPRACDRPPRRRGSQRRFASSDTVCRRDLRVRRRSNASMPRSAEARRSGSDGSTAVSELEPERLRPLLRGALGEPYLYRRGDGLDPGPPPRQRPCARRRGGGRAPDGRPRSLGPTLGRRAVDRAPLLRALATLGDCGVATALARRRARRRRGDRSEMRHRRPREMAERCARRRRQGGGDPARGGRGRCRLRDRYQREPGGARPAAGNPDACDVLTACGRAAVRPRHVARFGAGRARTSLHGLAHRWPRAACRTSSSVGTPFVGARCASAAAPARRARSLRTAGSRSSSSEATSCSWRAVRSSSCEA